MNRSDIIFLTVMAVSTWSYAGWKLIELYYLLRGPRFLFKDQEYEELIRYTSPFAMVDDKREE